MCTSVVSLLPLHASLPSPHGSQSKGASGGTTPPPGKERPRESRMRLASLSAQPCSQPTRSQHLETSFQNTDLAASLHWFRRVGGSPFPLPTLAELPLPCPLTAPLPGPGGGDGAVLGSSLRSAGPSAPYHPSSPFPDGLSQKVPRVSLVLLIAVCCAFVPGLFPPPWFRSRCIPAPRLAPDVNRQHSKHLSPPTPWAGRIYPWH